MSKIVKLVGDAAKQKRLFFIHGEKGVGKLALAQYIHRCSDFRDRNSIVYTPQEFVKNTPQKITTIIIQDILNAPLTVQKQICDMIPNMEAHLIAITDGDYELAYERNELYPSLYYRLQLLSIHIPPLRERGEDIAQYVTDFLPESITISSEALQSLRSYHWPGNISELHNIMERALLLCNGQTIHNNDLFSFMQFKSTLEPYINKPLKTAVRLFKKNLLINHLQLHNWNQTHSAHALGIQRTYLARLLKELSINRNHIHE